MFFCVSVATISELSPAVKLFGNCKEKYCITFTAAHSADVCYYYLIWSTLIRIASGSTNRCNYVYIMSLAIRFTSNVVLDIVQLNLCGHLQFPDGM